MTILEKAKNAVMWHLYTHDKRAKISDLLELPGHERDILIRAINLLGKTKEIQLWYRSDVTRMNY